MKAARSLASMGLLVGAIALSGNCKAGADDSEDCPVGGETCACTEGGACDPGLACLSGICVNPVPTGSGGATSQATVSNGATMSTTGPFMSGSTGSGNCMQTGCKKIDILFALDGSGSMQAEINALSATQAFTQTIQALEAVNCGDIHYRVGVTNDVDGGFMVPNGWAGPKPWFDSEVMSATDIANAFNGACSKVTGGNHPVGCEHVLSTSANLVLGDSTGFVRPDALLVFMLLTDVDDYGAYDQLDQCIPTIGCAQSGAPIPQIYSNLVALKANDPKALATIIVAGDPTINGGVNFCGAPGTCGCMPGGDCDVFHADRLWQFAASQTGMNGFTANLCNGPSAVPQAVTTALTSNIDLACQNYVPPM